MSWSKNVSNNAWRCGRLMSMYPRHYVNPIYQRDAQCSKRVELSRLSHMPIKGALNNSSDTIFNGEIKQKMINYITKNGEGFLSRKLMVQTFEMIKRTQLEASYITPEANERGTDAESLLIQAVENCRPLLQLSSIKRGGVKYHVPIPLTNKKSYFLAMKWLLEASREKDRKVSLPEKLAWEILDAAHGHGRVIKKKEELNRQCESNRAYAHYRWS
ncbi:small ribosomal subunit protein uS7m [Drosophila tropicalis]|uniref:small ribosomal subunit protein uS7m n=1 Tax=Drosophila tropicalis TaxID=46794 RepID=UPI0035ABE3D3